MSKQDFSEDVFTTLGHLAMEYVGRRLMGENPKLRVHFELEDEWTAEDTDQEVHRVPHTGTVADDRPRKATPAPRVRRKAVR